jgi:hypothetical protein
VAVSESGAGTASGRAPRLAGDAGDSLPPPLACCMVPVFIGDRFPLQCDDTIHSNDGKQ